MIGDALPSHVDFALWARVKMVLLYSILDLSSRSHRCRAQSSWTLFFLSRLHPTSL